MNGPLFSVVVPTYNRRDYIVETLESVFDQTYTNYEVIVVDNCSTDDTEEILKPYIEAGKIRFIKHEQNFERARSRNTGMDNAAGDFLTFLDSDDFLYPGALHDAAEFSAANPGKIFFHTLYELVDGEKQVIYEYRFPPLDDRLRAIASGNFLSCIGVFMHRDIYSAYRFDTSPDLTGGEDWEFWLRVIGDNKLERIEKIDAGMRHHEGRSIKNQSLEPLEKGLRYLMNKFRSDPHLLQVYRDYHTRIETSSWMYMASLSLSGGLFAEAKRYLKLAFKADRGILFSMRFLRILRRIIFRLPIR